MKSDRLKAGGFNPKYGNELGKAGIVRVIVELQIPDAKVQNLSADTMLTERKTAIAMMQQQVLSRHFGSVAEAMTSQSFDRGLRLFSVSPLFAITLDGAELEKLTTDPEVKTIYPDRLEKLNLHNSVPLIGMTGNLGAYSYGATGKGQVVAVIDIGVQSSHPFLSGKVINAACFSNAGGAGISLCPNGAKQQTGPGAAESTTAACYSGSVNLCGHGTHVAGIAVGNNPNPGIPQNGVAKDAELVAVQIFTRFNDPGICDGADYTPCTGGYLSDSISALEWVFSNKDALGNGRTLAAVNMSFGGGTYYSYCETDPRNSVLDLLRAAGVAPVAASGNEYHSNAVSAPGCVASVVTVGATNLDDTLALFSNESKLMVDLMAPGRNILSSVPTSLYATKSGTSMAAPHAAGAFAAIRSRLPSATVNQIEVALKSTGAPIKSYDNTYTKPRIQVNAALEALGAKPQQTLTISTTGSGTIQSVPAGINCGSICSAEFNYGQVVTLTAAPLAGHQFTGWGGACSGTSPSCVVTVDSTKSISASFTAIIQTQPLNVTKSGSGTVLSTPEGINCGTLCSASFNAGSSVSLVAIADYGYGFAGWTGACSGSTVCVVTMNGALSVAAQFYELPKYLLKVTKVSTGTLTSEPGGINCGGKNQVCKGMFSSLKLMATPNPGYYLRNWVGCPNSEGSTCFLSLTGPATVKAVFTKLPKYTLRVSKTKFGAITSSPPGLKCGNNAKACSAKFVSGTALSLIPAPQAGRTFQGWSGDCSGSGDCLLLMDGNKSVSATFQ